MLSDPHKVDNQGALMQMLQQELHRIDAQRYQSQPQYIALIEEIQSITIKDSGYAQLSRELLSRLQDLSLHIVQKIKVIIDECIGSIQHLRDRVVELEGMVQLERERGDAGEEQMQVLAKNMGALEMQYERLKGQKAEMELQYKEKLKRVKKDKKEITRTFLQVREDTEEDKKLMQNLHFQKIQIKEQMQEEKRTKQTLLQQIEEMKRTVTNHERQINASATKLSYQERRIARLQEQLTAKSQVIQRLLAKQLSLNPISQPELEVLQLPLFDQVNSNQSRPRTDRSGKHRSFVNTYNLGQEINLNEDYQLNFNRQTSTSIRGSMRSVASQQEIQLNHSVVEEESSQSRVEADSRRVMIPDLYFAHYLLTVQAVKLKLGREELFGIEMRDYYATMIEEGVAFHQWDEWIAKTLKEMGKRG